MTPAAAFPTLDFPVFGLERWRGSRWLAWVGGAIGEPARSVWLAHATTVMPLPDRPWAWVASMPAARSMALPGEQPAQAAAVAGLHVLLNLTAPELDAEQRKVYWPAALAAAAHHGRHIDTWATTVLAIDDRDLPAYHLQWAGVTVTVCTATDEVAVIVLSVMVSPEQLALQRLSSGSEYHFDLAQPLEYPAALTTSMRAAPNLDWSQTKWSLHPDQRQLLDVAAAADTGSG